MIGVKDYLIFRLYGPMASWGDVAVGEYRPTFDRPSKSAVIGLLGAALGIYRDEEEKQKELAQAYNFAVQINVPGVLLRDYHTSQVPPSGSGKNKKDFATRKDELEAEKKETILSTRDYYCDALYTVCIWGKTERVPYSLEILVQKLIEPEFVLYLGRKSCPIAIPTQAKIVEAENLNEVFSKVKFEDRNLLLRELPESKETRLYWEGDDNSLLAKHTVTRRDDPLSRRRWQFSNRKENYMLKIQED